MLYFFFLKAGFKTQPVLQLAEVCAHDIVFERKVGTYSKKIYTINMCSKGRGMCYPVCGMMHIKEPLLLIERVAYVAAAGFLSRYLGGPLPYV